LTQAQWEVDSRLDFSRVSAPLQRDRAFKSTGFGPSPTESPVYKKLRGRRL